MILYQNATYNGDVTRKQFVYEFLRKNVSPIGDVICFRGTNES
jgi:hypothetical protein